MHLIILIFLLIPAMCFARSSDELLYFPTTTGSTWIYEGLAAGNAGLKVRVLKSDGDNFAFFHVGGFVEMEATIFYEKRGSKLLRVATQNIIEGYSKSIYPYIELVLPIKTGTTWQFDMSSKYYQKCRMDMVDSYTVKAGTFNAIAKRSCTYYEKKSKKSKKGKEEEVGNDVSYFAPNVGLIKKMGEKEKETYLELTQYTIR